MITLDMKTLIRRGIPINLRGMVWKAIVDNRQASDLLYLQDIIGYWLLTF